MSNNEYNNGEEEEARDMQMGSALLRMLSTSASSEVENLRVKADAVRAECVGNKVYLRGIIEFSNCCEKDCFYCGIRKGNAGLERYSMKESEIMECAMWAFDQGYGSIVLQSGENTSKPFIDFVVKLVAEIKKKTKEKDARGKGLGITLCVGEQSAGTYREFFDAGAHRYLLRIETSNPALYGRLHPESHSFANRVKCLRALKEIGFQLGTGVMIGLPGQTLEDLANDILFFREIGADMIGMGPYVIHSGTPMNAYAAEWELHKKEILQLSLNMVSATRLFLRDVNIAAATAFDVFSPSGRDLALSHGANIMMPSITPTKFRRNYLLYDGKPCVDEDAGRCRSCHAARIKRLGRQIGWGEYGDSPHFIKHMGILRNHEITMWGA
jgi:biotin synthase